MKQLKRLHLSNLKETEMGNLWGGYTHPGVVVTPGPTLPPWTTPPPHTNPTDGTRVTPPVTPIIRQ